MTTIPATDERPAPAEAIALARQSLADFPWCFWMRAKEAPVATIGEVQLIVQRLRQHGDRNAWNRAYEVEQTLTAVASLHAKTVANTPE
jgi:hypothetical protein